MPELLGKRFNPSPSRTSTTKPAARTLAESWVSSANLGIKTQVFERLEDGTFPRESTGRLSTA
jgi:hypothetical protein